MSKALRPTQESTPAVQEVASPASSVLELWLASRPSRGTERTYRDAIADFESTLRQQVDVLFKSQQHASTAASAYKAALLARSLAPATINVRLSAIRSLVEYVCEELKLITWTLRVKNVKVQKYRDTRGPGTDGVKLLRQQVKKRTRRTWKPVERDTALLSLMSGLGLRRGEAVALDLEDVDLEAGTLQVQGKGQGGQKVPVTMPDGVKGDVEAWLKKRGSEPGPLFEGYIRGGSRVRGRLTGDGLSRLVRRLASAAGIKARAHGLRHTAITTVLDVTKDVRAARRFSRHKDLRVLGDYDDNRSDLGGEAAKAIESEMREPEALDYYVLLVQKGKPNWKTANKVVSHSDAEAVRVWIMQDPEMIWKDERRIDVLVSTKKNGAKCRRMTATMSITYDCAVQETARRRSQ